jgi:hypothetical protein
MLDGVKVRGLGYLGELFDLLLMEELGDNHGRVLWVIVLPEY